MAAVALTTMPILLDLPMSIRTKRLSLIAQRAGDGDVINAAVADSFAELHRWMPWAKTRPTANDTEIFCRESAAKFLMRSAFEFGIWTPDERRYVGAIGLHPHDWNIPRFEIGYWIRTADAGRGFATEAVRALTDFAMKHVRPARLQIRAERENAASRRVAEKSGFELEGIHRKETIGNDGTLRDMCYYAFIPPAAVACRNSR